MRKGKKGGTGGGLGPVRIADCPPLEEQECVMGGSSWAVTRLIGLTGDLPILEIPMKHLNIYQSFVDLTLRKMVVHCRAVRDYDMSHPIILDEDGDIMDGRHRVMRALLEERETILAVRFDTNPPPCRKDRG